MNRRTISLLIVFLAPLSSIFALAHAEEFQSADCSADTVDCTEWTAGYEWANQNSFDSVDACMGESDSFLEGCRAFVSENHED